VDEVEVISYQYQYYRYYQCFTGITKIIGIICIISNTRGSSVGYCLQSQGLEGMRNVDTWFRWSWEKSLPWVFFFFFIFIIFF
jgi:hypothetical protein